MTLCKKYFSEKSNFIQTYACTEACSSISFLELDLFSDLQKTNEGMLSSPLPLNDQSVQNGNINGEVKPVENSLLAKLNRPGIPVGFPSSIIELKIIDTKTKKPLDNEQVGEICVKGPSIMLGYYNNNTATEKAFAYEDGWLLTGDFGYIVMENLKPPRRSLKNTSSVCTLYNDAKPSLYLLGRGPDIIRSGGENISSLDIENVIEELPFVQKAAVLGIADELFGERPVAICIIKGEIFNDATNKKANKNVLKGKIMSHCQRSLSRYKCPKEILIVDTLPYTSSGKIQKHLLRSKL